MLQALLLQRTAFIELLVMNGFVMKNFLTVEKLAKLYNEAVTQFQAWNYAKNFFVLFLQTKKFKELNIQLKQICGINSSVILLRHIHKFLQVIVKDHSHPIYKYHTYKVSIERHLYSSKLTFTYVHTVLKMTEKVSFNIASKASYVYILNGQKLIKNEKNYPFWRVFENLKPAVKQSYQTGQF